MSPFKPTSKANSRQKTPGRLYSNRPTRRKSGRAARHARPNPNKANHASFAGALFPESTRTDSRFGIGVLLAVLERQGGEAELGFARVGRFHRTAGQRPRQAVLGTAEAADVARILSGLAHPDRIRILRAILQGAATHHALRKAVTLKTGPLYHHLRALERAGILTMSTRNVYELTERGRIALWVTNTLGAVFTGKRMIWNRRRWTCRQGKKAS